MDLQASLPSSRSSSVASSLPHERQERLPLAHARPQPVTAPLALALAGGGVVGFGLWRRGALGTLATTVGVGLSVFAYYRLAPRVMQPLEVFRAVTVDASPQELFARWMDLPSLPTFMRHLVRVEMLGPKRSRWTARDLGKLPRVQWDAELVEVRENELVQWRSLPGSLVHNEGTVTFVPVPGGRGTEVHARILYRAPGGTFGRAAAAAMQRVFAQQVHEDLRRFKQLVETGEIPTIEGQPHGK